jgi:PAS domain S-box-containing protein
MLKDDSPEGSDLQMSQMSHAGVSDAKIAEKLKMSGPELSRAWSALMKRVHSDTREEAVEIVIARMILEAKRALDQEKAELALIVANHREEAVLIMNNMGTITGVCKSSAIILGKRAEDLIGMPVDVLLAGGVSEINASSDEMARAEAGEKVHSTRTHLRDDGSTFEAEHTLIALVGRMGEVSGFARDICDVTERRLHEVRIEELNASVHMLVPH